VEEGVGTDDEVEHLFTDGCVEALRRLGDGDGWKRGDGLAGDLCLRDRGADEQQRETKVGMTEQRTSGHFVLS
jgi:hypothetical protein